MGLRGAIEFSLHGQMTKTSPGYWETTPHSTYPSFSHSLFADCSAAVGALDHQRCNSSQWQIFNVSLRIHSLESVLSIELEPEHDWLFN